jgi:uncharacterized coiled-coil protein SlyX
VTFWEIVLAGLPILIGAAIAWSGHRRSKRVDAVSEQSGVATEARAGTAQIIEGLNQLIDQLQEDYREARLELRAMVLRLDALAKERDALTLDLARLRKRYGVNGENGPSTPAKE